jgi:hypothetical protein
MASTAEWIIGAFILGAFIGILLAKDVNSFGVEVAPDSTLKAFVNFTPALPS